MKNKIFAVLALLIAICIIGSTTPYIVKHVKLGLDLRGGFEILYVAEPLEKGQALTKELLNKTAESIAKRADKSGIAEPDVTTEGKDRIRVRLAGVSNQEELRKILQEPAQLAFRSGAPDFARIELVGSDFVEGGANVGFDQANQPVVNLKVKDADKFKEITTRLLNQPLAIYLDDRQLSVAEVRTVIADGTAQISGGYTFQKASSIRDTINLGALPLKLTEKYTQSVRASLGQQSLEETGIASVIASVLILLFLLVWYRVPGIIASIALISFAWLMLLGMVLMNATLTLPGIAAFVLSAGIAVDSNIIMAERIKDEIRNGKSILSSVRLGSKHSFRTIIDAHVTTALAGIVLYANGTGSIKGFAVTLLLSILLNILTNVFFSRWLLHLIVRSNIAAEPSHFGIKKLETHSNHSKFDLVKRRRTFFTTSIAITLIGIVSLLLFNLNYGVDFRSGTSFDISVGQPTTQNQAASIFQQAGHYSPVTLTIGGADSDRFTARFDKVLEHTDELKIEEAFKSAFGDKVSMEVSTVDTEIAKDLGKNAIWSVFISTVGILIYMSIRFEWRFAIAAIVALLHDAFIVVSLFSIFRFEVNLPFVAAELTIIGYSINDTIVIFDRIRENLRFTKVKSFNDLSKLINLSIWQTMTRSINTVVTVLIAALCLFIFGSPAIRLFSLAMILGLVSGTYSSIFIASPIWMLLKRRTLVNK